MRRSSGVLLGIALFGGLAAWGITQAQVAIQVAQPVPAGLPATVDSIQVDPNQNDLGQAITLPTDSKLKLKLEAGRDYIEHLDWDKAFAVLQGLLELREDQYVEMTVTAPDGKSRKQWSSVRTEANKLIGSMPAKGLEYYRQTYGGRAKADLTDAVANSDPDRLAAVMLRYFYTDAGAEATNMLGTYMLDRGQSISAAQCFEKLLKRDGPEKLPPLILFKAYLAFHRAGDKEKESQVWKQLEARAPDGVKLGGQSVALGEMKSLVDQMKDSVLMAGVSDWVNFGGDATHSALGKGTTPFMDPGTRKWPMAREATTKNVLNGNTGTIRMLEGMQQAVLPAYFPIAVNVHKESGDVPVMVYRSFWGVTARNIKTGQLLWEAASDWSLDTMFRLTETASHLNQWIGQWQQMGRPSSLIENSVIGTLSTDHVRVYLVDDLAVAPSFQMMGWGGPWGNQGQPNLTGRIGDAIHHSRLQAWNLETGKIEWTLGGRSNNKKAPNDLDDCFFLGPPLSLGGKLYFLTERNQEELRLVCLDPSKIDIRAPEQNLKEAIQWVQTLATTREKMVQDVARRAQAAHLAYGDGVLVCPTNAGAVLGVDLLTHSLVWAYPYREKTPNGMGEGKGGMMPGMAWGGMPPQPSGGLLSDWKVTAPVIQDGKVVFAAADGSAVHCISLREGKFLWEQKKTDKDLYLGGVYDGKVVIVSKDSCRALKLSDGSQAWQIQTGMPSGVGIASDNLYYLPLKYAIESPSKDPEVCVIDMNAGRAIAHTKSHRSATKPAELPGNLLFFEGDVISQNASDLSVFPQLKIKMAQMNDLLARNANDPVGLTERGELNLDDGKLLAAVDDLRKAMKNNPPADVLPKTKLKLYESLTELLQSDFGKAKEYLDEYEKLCQVDIPTNAKDTERRELEIEGQHRLANRLCLLAKGLEGEQKLAEAFKCYMDFIGVVGTKDQKELISVIDEPLVKASPDVWAQGRISAMVNNKNYTEAARKPLEDQIKEKWASVRGKNDLTELRRFVSMFGSLFSVGQAARMELAERLMEEPGTANLLEAELQLNLLQDPQNPELAARAVEATARLMTRKGLLAEAAYYYRLLARTFPNVPVRDGKTSNQLLDDLATDKRFLPYLDNSGPSWKASKMRAEMRNQQRNDGQPVYNFETEGELTPFFQQYKVTLNFNFQQFRLTDRLTGEDKWTHRVDIGMFQQFLWNSWGANNIARFPYQRVGHLIVLNFGQKIYGLDPINKVQLWSKDLAGPNTFPQNGSQFQFDPNENVLQIIYPTGHRETIGHIGPADAAYVCLVNRDGLTAIDPTNGRTLWNRIGVGPKSHVFGDSRHLYVIEMDNGTPGATKVLRAYDGVEVKNVPPFGKLYEKRLATRGHLLLLGDQAPTGTTLRLYDVLTGKDTWKKEFPAGSVILRSEDHDMAGAVDPNGKVVVIDLKSKREVLKAQMAPKHVAKVNEIHVMHDNKFFYLACNGPVDPNLMGGGGTMPNVQPGTGLRSIGVNGEVYAFSKTTGKVHWHTEVPGQMLLVDQFQELPLLVFTARNQRMVGGAKGAPGMWTNTVAVTAIDKRTGKRIYDRNDMDGNSTQQFTALKPDIKTGKIELVTWNLQIIFSPVDPETAAAPAKGKTNQSKLDQDLEKRIAIQQEIVIQPPAVIIKDK